MTDRTTTHPPIIENPHSQIIENARPTDIRPGDHITRVSAKEVGSVAVTVRREGVAHHRNEWGVWLTEDGGWLTTDDDVDEDITITIHRPAQPLPPERDGVVLVPADGHDYITTTDGQVFSRLTFTTKQSIWYGPNLAAHLGDWVIQTTTPSRLTPDTWKEDGQ